MVCPGAGRGARSGWVLGARPGALPGRPCRAQVTGTPGSVRPGHSRPAPCPALTLSPAAGGGLAGRVWWVAVTTSGLSDRACETPSAHPASWLRCSRRTTRRRQAGGQLGATAHLCPGSQHSALRGLPARAAHPSPGKPCGCVRAAFCFHMGPAACRGNVYSSELTRVLIRLIKAMTFCISSRFLYPCCVRSAAMPQQRSSACVRRAACARG